MSIIKDHFLVIKCIYFTCRCFILCVLQLFEDSDIHTSQTISMVQNNLDGTSALAKSNIAVTQIKMSWVFIFIYIYLA